MRWPANLMFSKTTRSNKPRLRTTRQSRHDQIIRHTMLYNVKYRPIL